MDGRPIDLSNAPSADDFKILYPEFRDTPPEVIDRALADAHAALAASVFGARHSEAIGLYAANQINQSAYGMNARLQPGDPDASLYGRQLKYLIQTCAAGLGRVARVRGPWWL